ncbi:hypothetical protein B0H63DRAFT_111799 [Podospora didyma]|uniref:SH3 domain-containing protein n=1 Tax=Podospora didyma TaxID=330526 RepID=A0AAE0U4C6_9PEZI|nr:hypothetical protein B0H63DRAFT_111799 [Podospora didyma]
MTMFKVKALYEYTSPHEDDLAFQAGQIITVTEEEDAEWYAGEYVDDAGTKHEGIFPRNFVEKYEPTAPPRPVRTRTARNTQDTAGASEASSASAPALPPPSPAVPAPEPEEKPEPVRIPEPTLTVSSPPAAPAPAPEPPAPKPAPPVQASVPPPPAPQPAEGPAARSAPPPKPAAPTLPKVSAGPPPPVSEKPAGASSFRDRIAAFNKPAAPPVAPFKPGGFGSGSAAFVKKPFVAPPPARNAYVPPPQQAPTAKVYRRDEDPEVKEQEAEALENAGKAGLVPAVPGAAEGEGEEDQPKPLSLKERLALLQKQQLETAARHADAVAKKEKPKRPPKKRMDSYEPSASATATDEHEPAAAPPPPPPERRDTRDTEEAPPKRSMDESHPPRIPHPPRRKSSKGIEPRDGNEADMSGAGETTEDQEELTEKEDADERPKHIALAAKQDDEEFGEEEEVDEEDEDDDVDPEVRRKEELRARMAKMSGGMGMPGMPGIPLFGGPPPMPKKKKTTDSRQSAEPEEPSSPTMRAPPIPPMMALPGMSRQTHEPEQADSNNDDEDEEEEARLRTPHQETAPSLPSREPGAAPPLPTGRPTLPPVPADSRPPPPPPPASAIKSASEGSVSDDELSERPYDESDRPRGEVAQATRAPPPPPPMLASPPPPLPPTSPRGVPRRQSYMDGASPTSPTIPAAPAPNRRNSRQPPPVPSSAPAPPPPSQTRPPPPPPTAAPPLRSHEDDDDAEEEITEYEGDYDTDIASSVPHKDALKSHQRESSFEDAVSPRSPIVEAPPIPSGIAPRAGPPPIPSQPPPPPNTRKSTDMPRVAPPPPPPPPPKETPRYDDDYDPYSYIAPVPVTSSPAIPAVPSFPMPTPPPHLRQSEDSFFNETPSYSAPHNPRAPPPAPPAGRGPTGAARQSLDVQRPGGGRRSMDVARPSMDSHFVANDIDLAGQSGWWLQPNSLPPQLQGRKDIFFESEESSAANTRRGGKTIVTRDIYVLFQDYSQTVITVRFDPQDASDVQLEQRHEAPPRALRQDQLEQSYERFGRAIGEAVVTKKDTVVGDGTPQGLIYELLRPLKDALLPVGTRAYGALVYSNLANASTTQNDEIRPGDIISIRNAKFQGKHGAMHAKYSMEVGKPDHVAVVGEWDGTKKKVRAWEQGRESKKVKLESFKLDDLRSGEVKIWRVMPRSWIGWEGQGNSSGGNRL